MSETDAPLRVMLVDDHALVRSAIRQAITAPDVEVVGEASTAEEALALAPTLRPDVMLLDLDLPGMSGSHLVRELAPRLPQTKIVMLTVSTSRRDLLDAMRHGARGYLTKDLSPDALLRSVRGIRRGDLPMSRIFAAHVVDELARAARRGSGTTPDNGLSSREEEVLNSSPTASRIARSQRTSRSRRAPSRPTSATSCTSSASATAPKPPAATATTPRSSSGPAAPSPGPFAL